MDEGNWDIPSMIIGTKETDNSRNGHSQKTMHTSDRDMEIDIPKRPERRV